MRPKPRWSPLEAETALREHEAGAPVSDIASQLGKSQSAVWNFLVRHGRRPSRKAQRSWTARERAQVVALRSKGVPVQDIAGVVGVSGRAVAGLLHRVAGTSSRRLVLRPSRWPPRPWDGALCELVSLMIAELVAEGGRVGPELRTLDVRLWMARQEVGLEAREEDDVLAGRLAARWGVPGLRRGPTGVAAAPRDVLQLVDACREAHDASCRRNRAELRRAGGAA